MNTPLVESQHGHGGLGHFVKPTDWRYENLAPGDSAPFDWEKGFDIEEKLATALGIPGFKLPVEDQGQSSSCGGQAAEKYAEVLDALIKKKHTNKSAKFIYAQVFQPGGGSFGGDLMSLIKNQGVSREDVCASYIDGRPPTEQFMEQVNDITEDARKDAKGARSSNYAFIFDVSIDTLAQAVRDNNGIIIGIDGENNGTWLSAMPVAPQETKWRHWLYVGKAKLVDGKKCLVALNSWGYSVGIYGWQYITEDYILSGHVPLGMTMIFGVNRYSFKKDLHYGMTDADVLFLQRHLNKDPDTQVAQTGVGSPGNESYYFGSLTKAAVIRYQKKWGITPAIGYVGPITRGVLNQ